MPKNLQALLPPNWKTYIDEWLKEDIPSFDYGGFVVGEKQETAVLYCKSSGVVTGVPFVNEIFHKLNCTVDWKVEEGQFVLIDGEELTGEKAVLAGRDGVEAHGDSKETKAKRRVEVAIVKGKAKDILLGERVALNLMARASGIATRARAYTKLAEAREWRGRIAGTRKTTPGFRVVEKYAMLVGGADTHRFDLSSMIMLKDNHVQSTGSITNAVKKAREVGGFSLKVEVECRNQKEAEEAIEAGADVIMLDNFLPTEAQKTSLELKKKYKEKAPEGVSGRHSFLIEVSGGVSFDNVASYFGEGVDIISVGSLTQSVFHVDFSLKITA